MNATILLYNKLEFEYICGENFAKFNKMQEKSNIRY